jgi:hypothetical protein
MKSREGWREEGKKKEWGRRGKKKKKKDVGSYDWSASFACSDCHFFFLSQRGGFIALYEENVVVVGLFLLMTRGTPLFIQNWRSMEAKRPST